MRGQETHVLHLYKFLELGKQMAEVGLSEFDRIVLASSSGGTQAGLAYGAAVANSKTQVLGISVDETKESLQKIGSKIEIFSI